jgi:hypothetical protein
MSGTKRKSVTGQFISHSATRVPKAKNTMGKTHPSVLSFREIVLRSVSDLKNDTFCNIIKEWLVGFSLNLACHWMLLKTRTI